MKRNVISFTVLPLLLILIAISAPPVRAEDIAKSPGPGEKFVGYGIQFRTMNVWVIDTETGKEGPEGIALVVDNVIGGGPAEKAGMQTDDLILKINGKDAFTMSRDEIMAELAGPEGTEVTFIVARRKNDGSDDVDRITVSLKKEMFLVQ